MVRLIHVRVLGENSNLEIMLEQSGFISKRSYLLLHYLISINVLPQIIIWFSKISVDLHFWFSTFFTTLYDPKIVWVNMVTNEELPGSLRQE